MKKYFLGVLLLTSIPAWAVLPYEPTPAEVAMCEAHGMPSNGGRYQGHYCDGLRFVDRANAALARGNRKDMQYYLGVAIDNFDYELRHTKNDIRRGEVHVNKARAFKLMGKRAEAANEFDMALKYEVKTPDVYQALADHFHEVGNKQKALEMATEGLKQNPNSKGLKRRYTEFGGKLPYPEAVAKTVPAEDAKAEAEPVAKLDAAKSPGAAVNETTDAEKLSAPVEPTPQITPPKVGSPKNPWCRFCPPEE